MRRAAPYPTVTGAMVRGDRELARERRQRTVGVNRQRLADAIGERALRTGCGRTTRGDPAPVAELERGRKQADGPLEHLVRIIAAPRRCE
jgi:hypothetical protein